jgi:hypothetical protein
MKRVELTEGGFSYFINAGWTPEQISEFAQSDDNIFDIRRANAIAEGKNLSMVSELIIDHTTNRRFVVDCPCYDGESFNEALNREIKEGFNAFYMLEDGTNAGYYESALDSLESKVIFEAAGVNLEQ